MTTVTESFRTNELASLKQCSRCEQVLEFKDFHKRTLSSDGLQSQCKTCQKEVKMNGTPAARGLRPDPMGDIVLTADQKRSAYSAAILRMVHAGLMSTEMASESLERVRAIED